LAGSFSIGELAQAARPTLFDAAARPELLIALVYANLMSPPLWDLMGQIRERAVGEAEVGSKNHTAALMAEIHQTVDKKFCHMAPLDTAEAVGLLDLEEERRRLSPETVDEALGMILASLEALRSQGRLLPRQDLLELTRAGRFPEFEYSAIDVVEALSRDVHRKHRPLGVTLCADEAALVAALALAEGSIDVGDLAILGSPVHYTLFVDHAHGRYWFNGKHEYHNSRSWRELAQGMTSGEIQKAVDQRVFYLDRIITPLGVHWLRHRRSTLPPDLMENLYGELREYFGIEIKQIAEAREETRFEKSPITEQPPLDIRGCSGADEVEKLIRSAAGDHPGTLCELSLYTHRSLHVTRPEAYIRAALRGWRVSEAANETRSLNDVLATVEAVAGQETILHSMDRIALPDEVLHFGRGSHRERALLLYCLCHLSPWISKKEKDEMEVVLCEGSSHVRLGGEFVDAATLETAEEIGVPWITMKEGGSR
jgi:hypothetical protein